MKGLICTCQTVKRILIVETKFAIWSKNCNKSKKEINKDKLPIGSKQLTHEKIAGQQDGKK